MKRNSLVSGDYNYDLNMDEDQFNTQLQRIIDVNLQEKGNDPTIINKNNLNNVHENNNNNNDTVSL